MAGFVIAKKMEHGRNGTDVTTKKYRASAGYYLQPPLLGGGCLL